MSVDLVGAFLGAGCAGYAFCSGSDSWLLRCRSREHLSENRSVVLTDMREVYKGRGYPEWVEGEAGGDAELVNRYLDFSRT